MREKALMAGAGGYRLPKWTILEQAGYSSGESKQNWHGVVTANRDTRTAPQQPVKERKREGWSWRHGPMSWEMGLGPVVSVRYKSKQIKKQKRGESAN